MSVNLHFLWSLVPAAARATWIDMGSKRPLWLLLLLIACLVVALRASLAPGQERWAAIRAQWPSELRDVCLATLVVGLFFFAYELFWNQPNKLPQSADLFSSQPAVSHRIPMFLPGLASSPGQRQQTICVRVSLPQGFSGGSYTLPFKPAGPSPPVLYDNGRAQRKGIDYTAADDTVVVKFKPMAEDSLFVMYTTDDVFADYLP